MVVVFFLNIFGENRLEPIDSDFDTKLTNKYKQRKASVYSHDRLLQRRKTFIHSLVCIPLFVNLCKTGTVEAVCFRRTMATVGPNKSSRLRSS